MQDYLKSQTEKSIFTPFEIWNIKKIKKVISFKYDLKNVLSRRKYAQIETKELKYKYYTYEYFIKD